MIQNEILAVLGKKGSGKSHYIKAWIARQRRPVVVCDRMDEYSAAGVCASDPVPGAMRFAGPAGDGVGGLRQFLETVERTGRLPRVSCVVDDEEAAEALCRWAMRVGGVAVVFEEADSYMSPALLPRGFRDLIRRGRHKLVDQVYCSRRPAELHRDVTGNADLEVYFQMNEGIDHDWLRKRAGEIVLDSVRKLVPRTYVERRP